MCLWNKCLSSTELTTLFTEDVSGTGLYLKSGTAWAEAQTIYKKSSSIWTEITASDVKDILDTGTKLIHKEV